MWDLRRVNDEKESNVMVLEMTGAGGRGIGALQFDEAGECWGSGWVVRWWQ